MVNKYIRKTQHASWSEATMKLAMEEVISSSVSAAAKKYGLTLSTLQRHIKKGSSEKILGRHRPVFNDAQEKELLDYVFKVDDLFYGITKKEFLELVYQYAVNNNIKHPFKNGQAGNDWYIGFKRRHSELVIRQPEPTSIARARGFNKQQVNRFYDILEIEINKYAIDAIRIYNVDETDIQTTSNKPPKILSRTGKKQVGVISSVERKLTKVVCCCNEAGSFIPPFFIFGRKRMVGRLLDGAPLSSAAACTDNGWINGPTFLEWLRYFVEITCPAPDRKVLLVMDNHESYKYLTALEYVSQNNLVFVSLPPHTTHRMQPLDRCVYGPLKTYFEQAVSIFQKSHVGRVISQYEVARLFGEAYMTADSAQNAIKGFKSTGLWPMNRHIFDESDFLPATLTDRPEPPELISNVETLETHDSEMQPAPAVSETSSARASVFSDRTVSPSTIENINFDAIEFSACPATLNETQKDMGTVPAEPIVNEQNSNPIPAENLVSNKAVEKDINDINVMASQDFLSNKENFIDNRISCATPVNAISLRPVSSSHDLTPHVKPAETRPLPTVSPNKTKRKRKIQKAEVLTITPIKEQLKAKEERKKLTKENKKKQTPKPSVEKKKNDNSKPSTSKTKKVKAKNIKKKQIEERNKKYYRFVCGNPYFDPPDEDWIKCGDCNEWAHEACTSYSGIGSYFCDLCEE